MNDDSVKEILQEELRQKKSQAAYWDTECDGCDSSISEGDSFYFFGDKKKVCEDCYQSMFDLLY